MLKSLFPFVIALGLAFSNATATADELTRACLNLSAPDVRVSAQPLPERAPVQHASIRNLTMQVHGTSVISRFVALGLTSATWTFENSYSMRSVQDSESGETCFRPGTVELVVGYLPLEVQVAEELPPNSCTYQEVLEHELEHVRIYERALPEAAKAISLEVQRELHEYLGRATNHAHAEELLNAKLEEVVSRAIVRQRALVQAENAKHDSAEEYSRVLHSCGGATRELLAHILRADERVAKAGN